MIASRSDQRWRIIKSETGASFSFLILIAVLCLVYEVRHQPLYDAIAIVLGALCALTSMRYFIDQSNRNFYLHRLDWERSETGDRP